MFAVHTLPSVVLKLKGMIDVTKIRSDMATAIERVVALLNWVKAICWCSHMTSSLTRGGYVKQ